MSHHVLMLLIWLSERRGQFDVAIQLERKLYYLSFDKNSSLSTMNLKCVPSPSSVSPE